MYSVVPMPQVTWEKEKMRYCMTAFPLVGVLTGLLLWGFNVLAGCFAFPGLLRAVCLSVLPIVLSGGIHVDGFLDTTDALASHRDSAEKRRILKDAHVGAFAVLWLVCLMLFITALWEAYPVQAYEPVLILLVFVYSRCLSGLSVLTFAPAEGSGLAGTFSEAGKGTVKLMLAETVLTAFLLCLQGIRGIVPVFAALCFFFFYKRLSRKEFGGLNGDQAGWFLTLAEMLMLAVIVFTKLIQDQIV